MCGAAVPKSSNEFSGEICVKIRSQPLSNKPRFPRCYEHFCYPCHAKKVMWDDNFYAFILCLKRLRETGALTRDHLPKDIVKIIYGFYRMKDVIPRNDNVAHYVDDAPDEYRKKMAILIDNRFCWAKTGLCPMNYHYCKSVPIEDAINVFTLAQNQKVIVRRSACKGVFYNDDYTYGIARSNTKGECYNCSHGCQTTIGLYRLIFGGDHYVCNSPMIVGEVGWKIRMCSECLVKLRKVVDAMWK